MADGISTRTQHDLLHQQQELERIEIKFDGSIMQLRSEVEKLGTEMRAMFEQLMAKSDAKHPSTPMGASPVGKKDANSLQAQIVNPSQQVDTT